MNMTNLKRRAGAALACLFVLLMAASTGHAKAAKVALLPLKISAADNAAFMGSVMADLLVAKLSLGGNGIGVIRLKDKAVPDAGFTDEAILETAKSLGADWGCYSPYRSRTRLQPRRGLSTRFTELWPRSR